MDIQTYPYMEESYFWEEVNIANQRQRCLKNTTGWQTLTIDPYIGRALCRSPVIGGLARIQTLVLHRDSINMEGPIFWWYHNTWRWEHKLLDTRIQFAPLCFFFFFFLPDPWDRACSSLYHVMVGGGTPSEGQLRITELLTLTVQSVKLLSSTGGSKTERRNTHTMNSMSAEAWVCANYQWFNATKYINSSSVLRFLYFT